MSGALVFNHHSLPFNDSAAAIAAIPEFLKVCIEAGNVGLSTILVDETVDRSWFRLELAPGFFWQSWYDSCGHSGGEHRDRARAFRAIATQSPFFNVEDIAKGVDLHDVSLDGCTSWSAVRAAAWYASPLVSFATRFPWDSSPLSVEVQELDPETAEINVTTTELLNFYSYSVFSEQKEALLAERARMVTSGREVVARFGELYPHVYLCGKATQQLNRWSASHTVLEQTKNCLQGLNRFAETWQEQPESSTYSAQTLRDSGFPHPVSGESETVRNTPILRRAREFWLPTGEKKFFEQHAKLHDGYRVHFLPDQESRSFYVAYIGPHLRLK